MWRYQARRVRRSALVNNTKVATQKDQQSQRATVPTSRLEAAVGLCGKDYDGVMSAADT
eukprot:SAG11_NODE_6400_length_1321_cov_1.379705_1_plen_58_part_10